MALVVREERGDRVAGLVLNRPEKLNAVSRELIAELVEAVDECVHDDSVGVIVIRGEGRAFSAGADASPTGTVPAARPSLNREDMLDNLWGRFITGLWDAPKPIIAEVHGYCLGIATVMCSFLDMVVVAEDAEVGWPSLPLGGGVEDVIWAWLIGVRKAKELAFQPGTRITGTEAAAIGWANRAVPAVSLHDDVQRTASLIARTPPGLLRLKKEAINRIQEQMGFRDTMRLSAAWCVISHTDPVVSSTIDVMREVGIKEAIAHFERGGKQ
jgi:enoyl-CoA hydratase